MNQVKSFFALIGGSIAVVLLIIMLIVARGVIFWAAPVFVILFLASIAYWLVAGTFGASRHLWVMGNLKAQRFKIEAGKLTPTEGNYPAVLIDGELIEPRAGLIAQPVPHTYSPHIVYQNRDTTRVTEEQPVAQVGTSVGQPALADLVEQLRPNRHEFYYGVERERGQLIKVALPQAVHIQLLGASGQGKSREAQSILAQLVATNDEQHLRLALIDCEAETTAPFHGLPHVSHLAEDEREAARTLSHLCDELHRRDSIAAHNKAQLALLPVILMFVEEFLNLRRVMPASIKDQALEDYTTLALRGRKRGMFLFAIGQTAYTEKAIRDAQMQFLSSMAFAIKPTAARSAGFTNTELLNKLYDDRRPGQFLLERPAGDGLLLAPYVDSDVLSGVLDGMLSSYQEEAACQPHDSSMPLSMPAACASEATLGQFRELLAQGAGKQDIIKAVWGVSPGGSSAYKRAQADYLKIMQQITDRAK